MFKPVSSERVKPGKVSWELGANESSTRMLILFLVLPVGALVALLLFGPRLWRSVYGPWMIGGMVLGAVLVAALSLYAIFHSTSSTAGIGILFVPFGMLFGGAVGAVLGFAVFQAQHLRESLRSGLRASAVALASLALLVVSVVYLAQQAARVKSFNGYRHADRAEALTAGAAENLRAKDYFVLSAIVANVKTPPAVLLDIVRNPDPELHRKRHDWLDMFDTDELAVVRKVLRNPRSPVEVLSILSESSDGYVLADVCADKRTSQAILRERCSPHKFYLVQWSLAGNPNTPVDLLEALSRAEDHNVAHGLAYNFSTPLFILRELARNEDPLVRQGVASNPSADNELITALSHDPVDYVSQAAKRRANRNSLP
jgi:hypothetical protein